MSLSPKKNLVFNLFLLIGTTLVMILAGEIGLRLFSPYEVINIKNSVEMDTGKEVERNSLGLRDREYKFDHDNFRVLALGDSFTFGTLLMGSGLAFGLLQSCNQIP